MKPIEDMKFYTTKMRDGRWVGEVVEFPSLRTRPMKNRLDALSDIVSLTSERIRELSDF